MPTHKRRTPPTPDPPTLASKRPKRTPKSPSLIERTNTLPLPHFSALYYPSATASAIQSSTNLHLSLTNWTDMHAPLREACLNLVESTSRAHYQSSAVGWSRGKKRAEMRHPAMRYLVLCRPASLPAAEEGENGNPTADALQGFLSFMLTTEDGFTAIYLYELHLEPALQGQGVGRKLVEVMEMIGGKVGVEKAMLTVFRSNERAVRAYAKWGYGVDEFSPVRRRLRDGGVREVGYVILSKGREWFAMEDGEEKKERDGDGSLAGTAEQNDKHVEKRSHERSVAGT